MGKLVDFRIVDDNGRLVIPSKIRKEYDINIGDSIEFYVDEHEKIYIKKYTCSCAFCDESSNIEKFKGKMICPKCKENLKKHMY